MPKDNVTQSQACILELFSAFEYLTTREICEYLAEPTTRRAIQQRLQVLRERGFIESALANPVYGRASERRWSLLKKGCDILGVAKVSSHCRKENMRRGVTPREASVLHLLAEMKHLTTSQVRRHLHGDKPDWYTGQLLNSLQRLGYIRGMRLYPELGTASEYYWTIRRAGAAAIGSPYDGRYLRRPARRTIEYRGLLLEMSRQVAAAGWSLIKPVPNCSREPLQGDAPQRRLLVEAVLYIESMTIQNLVAQGYPIARLQDRIERLKMEQIGAVVPRAVNDYVAYVPGRLGYTAVLIPHPPWAGRAFWTRRPGQRQNSKGRQDRPRARVDRYVRLSRVLPVLGLFASREAAEQYDSILSTAGLKWTLIEDLGDRLVQIAASSIDKAEA